MISRLIQYLSLTLASDYFEGSLTIDGVAHTMSCSCEKSPITSDAVSSLQNLLPHTPPSVCESIDSTSVIEEKVSKTDIGLSAEEVSAYYGQPRQIILSKNSLEEEFRCADARWNSEMAFTMGGDLGEFLLVVNAIDGLMPLDDQAIGQAMLNWLQIPRSLTYCTDFGSISNLNNQIGQTIDLNSPSASSQETIISSLIQNSDLQGDIFWKCLTGSITDYKIRKDLFKAVLKSFFSIHWAQDRIVSTAIKIHNEDHKPQAIIRNIEKTDCDEFPMKISPKQPILGGGAVSSLLYDTKSIVLRRQEMINHILPLLAPTIDSKKVEEIINHNSQEMTERCITSIFNTVPIYTLKAI